MSSPPGVYAGPPLSPCDSETGHGILGLLIDLHRLCTGDEWMHRRLIINFAGRLLPAEARC
ncbi:hypothetical protein PsYK624_154540 [Phanerochaete sordida]|uniref:Uncharacterized protein n=1 Tax=Phanerochaete sordida TaxID=48140 RepID=A0A9P3LLA7_9APHY|nr:hypothetical protein PsYK624_154540 [Phanerochaete sordida]